MGALDAQIAVKRDASDNIIATVELMKDGTQGEEFASRLEVVEVGVDDDGDKITSCVVTPVERLAPSRNDKAAKLTRHRHQEFIRFLNVIEADVPAAYQAAA